MTEQELPLVSIITPIFDRRDYLQAVFESLARQTYPNIEWVVANDGCRQGTVEEVKRLAELASFPVTLIDYSDRVGKAVCDNKAIEHSNGEFILWCDSDDELLPIAISELVKRWFYIDDPDVVGVVALCKTDDGILGNSHLVPDMHTAKLTNITDKLAADSVVFFKRSVLSQYPFPETDFMVPEACVWQHIGKVVYLDICCKLVHYRQRHHISFSRYFCYTHGRATCYKHLLQGLSKFSNPWKKVRYIANLFRYGIYSDYTIFECFGAALLAFNGIFPRISLLPISIIIGCAIGITERLCKPYIDTRTEFLSNIQIAQHKIWIKN